MAKLTTGLSSTGVLTYSVLAVSGDFTVSSATLVAHGTTTAGTSGAVPDGGTTASLLGLALFGMGALAKKLRT